MKRTISLVIAIAVMISMFIVPVSAAGQCNHFVDSVKGATSGKEDPATGGMNITNLSDYTGTVGCVFQFVGWVQPAEGQTVDGFVVSKDGGETFKEEGITATTKDRSNEMERLVGYTISLSTTGQTPNETGFYDEIAVVISGEICPIIGFTYKLVEQGTITKAEQIVPGETKLTQDITGQLCPSSGTYVIDLAGHTWRNGDIAIKVLGTADVTVIDSVGGGKIYANNDAIRPESGKLTLDGITVEADASGCDAVFIKGGNVTVKNCVLNARQASVHNDNEYGATVLVDGCTLNGDSVALKGRNNAVITITGNTVFNNKKVEMQKGFSDDRSVVDTFKAGEKATIEFDSIVVGNGVTTTVKNYTYTAPVETKLGASIEITNGIALDFVVSNAPANAVVMIDGVEFGASYVDGQDSHYILDGFGPHTMADQHTAELYVDGTFNTSVTYSVKQYCLDVINNGKAINDAHLALAKEILNYGAKAQVYVDYDAENLVNDGVVSEGKYDPADDVALILNDFPGASANWVNANVKFGDTLELIINLEGDADKVVVTIGTESTTYEVLTTASGAKYIVVTDITPDQFKTEIAAVAYKGDVKVSKTLVYSVGSYISDRVQNSTNEAYIDLVMALSIYGDAVAAFVA